MVIVKEKHNISALNVIQPRHEISMFPQPDRPKAILSIVSSCSSVVYGYLPIMSGP